MILFALPLLFQIAQATQPSRQTPAQLERLVAEQEATRDVNGGLVGVALTNPDTHVQALALRAIGRRQLPDLRDVVVPFLKSPDVAVRVEAATALGQTNADVDYASYLPNEKNGMVRAALFETIGRLKTPRPGSEGWLTAGLSEADPIARTGAARGLESYVRQNARAKRPDATTLTAMHAALRANSGMAIREFLLLAMNSARDTDTATYNIALRDTSALVRRLAVLGTKKWVDDKSPIVRYEALKAANNCERAQQLFTDANEMVQLAAIDMLGDKKCDASPLEVLVKNGKNWRVRSHALVALAKIAPASAKALLRPFVTSSLWQDRVYAATAAKVLGDSSTLATLARDTQPNVAVEAMTTTTDAIFALGSNDAGLLLAAANKLKGTPELVHFGPQLIAAIEQPGVMQKSSSADARNALLARLSEIYDAEMAVVAKQYGAARVQDTTLMSDNAKRIGDELHKWDATSTEPALVNGPLQPAAQIESNRGAKAMITMKGLGVITMELLFDEAPRTVTTFAALADSGKYNGLTFHRIVANFVLQGGSPGADEYDGQTEQFMRDEVGRTSHTRGTLGISTRGYDKGDGQIFINMVDNFRLDRQYTVFARITSGMDIVDRIQEGDVMESVKIVRKK